LNVVRAAEVVGAIERVKIVQRGETIPAIEGMDRARADDARGVDRFVTEGRGINNIPESPESTELTGLRAIDRNWFGKRGTSQGKKCSRKNEHGYFFKKCVERKNGSRTGKPGQLKRT